MEAFVFPRLDIELGLVRQSTRIQKESQHGQGVSTAQGSNMSVQRPLLLSPCFQSQKSNLPDKQDWSSVNWGSSAPSFAAAKMPTENLLNRILEPQPWQGGDNSLPSARDRSAHQGSGVNFRYGSCPPRLLAVRAGLLPQRFPVRTDVESPRVAVRTDPITTQRNSTGLATTSFGIEGETARTQSVLTTVPGFLIGQEVTKSWGITYNPKDKNIYVADRLEHSVLAFNLSGQLVRKFGSFGTHPEEFFRPAGVAIDLKRDRLLVSDKDNHRVVVYETNGKLVCLFGSRGYQPGQFSYPWGIDVSRDGSRVVVADSHNHRVQVFDGATYNYMAKFTVFETCPYTYKRSFDYPRDVLFDATGEHFYVTDFNVNVALKIDVSCTTKTIVNRHLTMNHPQGMAWDNFGNLLVCDSSNNCIRVFSRKGQYIWTIPCKQFKPVNVTVLPDGKLAIADGTTGGLRFL